MAYAIKYLFKFESSNGTTREIRVLQDGYSGDVIQRPLGRAPILKKQQNGLVHGTSLEFYAECNVDREFIEFYTSDPKAYRVDLYAGATLLWQGYITPELYSEPDIAPPYDVQVVATDGVGELKLYEYAAQGTVTLRTLLSGLLARTGLGTDIYLISSLKPGSAGAGSLLEKTINLDYLAGNSCYEVLTYILDTLHATITWWKGAWILTRETNVTFTNGKVRYFNTAGNSALLNDSVQVLGKMYANPAWPVGQLSTVIDPAKNRVTVQAPWHVVTCLRNPDMGSDADWTKAKNARYETDGYVLPININTGTSETAVISQATSMAGLRVPMNLSVKATGATSEITAQVTGAVLGVLLTYKVGNVTYHLVKGDDGVPVWQQGGDIGTYIPLRTRIDFQQPLATWDSSRIEAEELTIDNIPPFLQGTTFPAGTLTVYILGYCAKIYGAYLDVVLPKGYQDILRIDNGARGEGSEVEIAIGRETADNAYYAAFLQGLLLDSGNLITSFSDANFPGGMDYLAFIARDYALSVALPRAKVTGTVYLESGIVAPPLVFTKGALNYWLQTWSWNLYEDELEIEGLTLPSASLTVESETILESTASASSSTGRTSGGGYFPGGGTNYWEIDGTLNTLLKPKDAYSYVHSKDGLFFTGATEADFEVQTINGQRVIHSRLPFYSDGFISAGGLSSGGGSEGASLAAVWASLKTNSDDYANEKINAYHIPIGSGLSIENGVIKASATIYSRGTAIAISNSTISVAGTVDSEAISFDPDTHSGADASNPVAWGSASGTYGIKLSVNNVTKDLVLVSGYNALASRVTALENAPEGGITKIGTYQGAVTLGSNLSITENGVLSAVDTTYGVATTSTAGLMSADDKSKLNGIASGATNVTDSTVSGWGYVKSSALPGYASSDTAGIIKIGSGLTISDEGVVSVTGQTQGTVTRVDVGTSQYSPSSAGVVSLPAYPTTLPASDVSAWAKASTKPSYTFSELTEHPTTLSGYGITDAKIANGVITLGSNTITPLTAHQSLDGYVNALTRTPASGGNYVSAVTKSGKTITVTYATLPTSLPASDVYSWAKAETKPSYAFSEITGTASTSQIPTLAISKISGLQDALDGKQSLDADLTAIAGLTGTSGFLKKTAANTWALDTNTYLTTSSAASTYVSGVALNGNYLRVTKNGANTDLTIPYATTATGLNVTSIATEESMSGTGIHAYSGVGGTWSGAVTSMAYAAILAFGSPSRGWQIWARRGAGSLLWRNGTEEATAWSDERKIWDSGNSNLSTVNWTANQMTANSFKLASGTPTLTWDSNANAWHLSGNFYADGFISAGGVSSGGGASGVDLAAVWANLTANTGEGLNKVINVAHIPSLASISGNLTVSRISDIETWISGKGYLTSLSFAGLTSHPTTLAGYGITDWLVKYASTDSPDTFTTAGIYRVSNQSGTTSFTDGQVLVVRGTSSSDTITQIAFPYNSNNIYFRKGTTSNFTSDAWKTILNSANYTSYVNATNFPGLNGNQTITLSGDVSGSGTTSIAVTIGQGKVTNAMLAGSIENSKLNTIGVAKGGTGLTTWTGAYRLIYSSAATTVSTLAPNTAATRKFLRMLGTGSAGAAPAWDTVTKTDVGLSNVPNWVYTIKDSSTQTFTA